MKWFSDEKGYGFLTPHRPGAEEVFVHFKEIVRTAPGRRALADGAEVEFDIIPGRNGRLQAGHVILLPMEAV